MSDGGRLEPVTRAMSIKCAKAFLAQVCAGGYSFYGFALLPCDDLVMSRPGTFFHLPAGTVYAFCMQENGARMMEIAGAGSQSSSMFRSIAQEVAPGQPKTEDVPKLIEILGRFGAKVHSKPEMQPAGTG